MKTFLQLVIEELLRDPTPRICSDIEAEIIERTGFIPPRHSISSAVNTIGKKPGFKLAVNRNGNKFTYSLSESPASYVTAKPGKPAKEPRITLAESSKMFDQLLWAVRQGRGQA